MCLLHVCRLTFLGILPSTFEDKLKKEEKLKRNVTAKLEVARSLQVRPLTFWIGTLIQNVLLQSASKCAGGLELWVIKN